MKIEAIQIYQVRLPVVNGPYTYAGCELNEVESTVVEVICEDGVTGYGECCPLGTTYAPAHALGAHAAISEFAPHLIGRNPLHTGLVHDTMNAHLNGHNYAKAAIDIALWDIKGKKYDARICDLIGGAKSETVPSYYAIGTVSAEEAASIAIEKSREGFKRLQIKVGGRPIQTDIEVIDAVWKAVGKELRLAADANRSWTSRDTLIASNALAGRAIVFEQPCDSLAEIRRIRQQVQHPIYLDESTENLSIVASAAGSGLCDGFGFKLTRLGGITGLCAARDFCQALHLPHSCDDSWGGDIVAAACLQVGATVAPELNEGVWIAAPYIDGHYDQKHGGKIVDGYISLPDAPGLGIQPDLQKFGKPVAKYGA